MDRDPSQENDSEWEISGRYETGSTKFTFALRFADDSMRCVSINECELSSPSGHDLLPALGADPLLFAEA
jgi:hypothetical protein